MGARRAATIAGVLLVGLVVAWLAWPASDGPPGRASEPSPVSAPDDDADGWGSLLDDGPPDPSDDGPGARPWGEPGERRWADPEARRRSREARRARFEAMTPEERLRWARRRVEIVALGPTEPTLDELEVLEALREVRPAVFECVRSRGGFRAMREAMTQAGDGGVRRGLRVSFDVTPEGTLAEGTLVLDPPPPAPFEGCIGDAWRGLSLPPPGPDGAAVEVSLGRGRGRGGGRGPGPAGPGRPTDEPADEAPSPSRRR